MRIAIITPAFNVAPYIETAIRSVLAQTHRDWTMVVVDDGSSDDTAALARATTTDPRLRLLLQPHQGVSAARQAGLRGTDAEAVLCLDADDWLAPTALERLADALAAAPEAVAAVGAYARVTPEGVTGRTVVPAGGDLLRPLLVRNRFINGGHVLVRRTAVDAAGPFRADLAFGEDWEFWCRLAQHGYFVPLPDPAPVLFALNRPQGAYRRLAADPGAMTRCLDAIHGNPALADWLDPPTRAHLRRQADAEAFWILGREMTRHGAGRQAHAWIWRSLRARPRLRAAARLLVAHAAPLLPGAWRGPFRPYQVDSP